jgi:hypothetical protein
MAKNKTVQAPGIAPSGISTNGWKLGTDFTTVQIFPASGYWATYKDGGRYPIVAWAMQARTLREGELDDFGDDEVAPEVITRVIGLVFCDKDASLIEADDYMIAGGDEFTGYEWDL